MDDRGALGALGVLEGRDGVVKGEQHASVAGSGLEALREAGLIDDARGLRGQCGDGSDVRLHRARLDARQTLDAGDAVRTCARLHAVEPVDVLGREGDDQLAGVRDADTVGLAPLVDERIGFEAEAVLQAAGLIEEACVDDAGVVRRGLPHRRLVLLDHDDGASDG